MQWSVGGSLVCMKFVASLYGRISWLRKSQRKKKVCVCVFFSFTLKANRVLSGEVLRTGLRVSVLTRDEPG